MPRTPTHHAPAQIPTWTAPATTSFSLAPTHPDGARGPLSLAGHWAAVPPLSPVLTQPSDSTRSETVWLDSGGRLLPEELRSLQKTAKDINIPRLSGDSTFGVFSAWKSAIGDWFLGVGVTGENLHGDTVKYLGHRMFTSEFHEELRR